MTPVKVMVDLLAVGDKGEGLFGTDPQRRPRLGLRINLGGKDSERPSRPLSAGNFLPYRGETSDLTVPVQFITPESLEMRPLAAICDQILLDSQEGDVIAATKILDPKIESIVFLTGQGEAPPSARGRAGFVASFTDDKRRVPLGSCGDGMRRLLALSAALIRAKGGFLIVDEIDTGFHYSIMTDVWKLVVSTADRLNIQVFATTHSLDCIRGLAEVCRGNSVGHRWGQICAKLTPIGLSMPDVPPAEGFIGEADSLKVRVGVWLKPDNQRDFGKLEDLLRTLVPTGDTLYEHAEH